MFAKLLKHEWKGTAGILGWLSLAALGIGVMATATLRVLSAVVSDETNTDAVQGYLSAGLGVMLGFMALALVLYVAGTQILLLYRFYKNKFTDQGYLTFTLPVSSHQIFLSAFVNMLLWLAITSVVVMVAVLVALIFGTAETGLINQEIVSDISEGIGEWDDMLASAFGDDGYTYGLAQMLQPLVKAIFGTVIAMSCVTVGAVAAKKHKILAAFGIYYGISTFMGTVSAVLTLFFAESYFDPVNKLSFWAVFLPEALPQILLAVGGYFLSVYLMRNKLNLP